MLKTISFISNALMKEKRHCYFRKRNENEYFIETKIDLHSKQFAIIVLFFAGDTVFREFFVGW